MRFWFRGAIFCLVPLLYFAADWPVPKSIKCNASGTFQCKHTGKFEDPFDTTCTKYFLCNEFENERVEVELTCPENTFYDPVNESCSGAYKCICDEDNNSTTSTPTTSSTSETLTTIPYPDECEICSQCITSTITTISTNGSTIWTRYPFETTTSYFTTTKDTSTTEETTKSASELYNVTTSNASIDTSFSTTLLMNDTIWTTKISEITSSQYENYSTTESLTTSKYCSIGRNFTCLKSGQFANPNDFSCNSYFYCYVWSNGTIDQSLYSCRVGIFNPNKGACDISYQCPCLEATTIEVDSSSPTTLSPVITNAPTGSTAASTTTPKYCAVGGNFTCSQTGRFANPNDLTCNSYFYCFLRSGGNMGQYLYSCSVGTFNPSKGACDVTYTCPCLGESTTKSASSFSTSLTPVITNATTESTTLFSTTPKYCSVGGNFTCSQTGRFANPNDLTCNSYFYCFPRSGGNMGQYLYSCSVGAFNPSKGACDGSYICPCS